MEKYVGIVAVSREMCWYSGIQWKGALVLWQAVKMYNLAVVIHGEVGGSVENCNGTVGVCKIVDWCS